MALSAPMKLTALRMSEDEKRRLTALAKKRNVTLSYALREGARLYLEDARHALKSEDGERVAAT